MIFKEHVEFSASNEDLFVWYVRLLAPWPVRALPGSKPRRCVSAWPLGALCRYKTPVLVRGFETTFTVNMGGAGLDGLVLHIQNCPDPLDVVAGGTGSQLGYNTANPITNDFAVELDCVADKGSGSYAFDEGGPWRPGLPVTLLRCRQLTGRRVLIGSASAGFRHRRDRVPLFDPHRRQGGEWAERANLFQARVAQGQASVRVLQPARVRSRSARVRTVVCAPATDTPRVLSQRRWLASRGSKTYTFRFEPPDRITFSESETSDPLLSVTYDLSAIELSSIGAAYIGFTGASHCTVNRRAAGRPTHDTDTLLIPLARQAHSDRGGGAGRRSQRRRRC